MSYDDQEDLFSGDFDFVDEDEIDDPSSSSSGSSIGYEGEDTELGQDDSDLEDRAEWESRSEEGDEEKVEEKPEKQPEKSRSRGKRGARPRKPSKQAARHGGSLLLAALLSRYRVTSFKFRRWTCQAEVRVFRIPMR